MLHYDKYKRDRIIMTVSQLDLSLDTFCFNISSLSEILTCFLNITCSNFWFSLNMQPLWRLGFKKQDIDLNCYFFHIFLEPWKYSFIVLIGVFLPSSKLWAMCVYLFIVRSQRKHHIFWMYWPSQAFRVSVVSLTTVIHIHHLAPLFQAPVKS